MNAVVNGWSSAVMIGSSRNSMVLPGCRIAVRPGQNAPPACYAAGKRAKVESLMLLANSGQVAARRRVKAAWHVADCGVSVCSSTFVFA